jgi:hypothetical protein
MENGDAESITIRVGEGNFSYSEKVNREYILDGGNLSDVRDGDQEPVEVSFDLIWDYITAVGASTTSLAGNGVVEDFLKAKGEYSGSASSDTSDPCAPHAVDIKVEITPKKANCGDKETITLANFRYEQLDHDLSASRISISGKCNIVEASVVRAAYTG